MSDDEVIADAREIELRALFANLHRALAGGDAFAIENFEHGLRVLDCAQHVALKALSAAGTPTRAPTRSLRP